MQNVSGDYRKYFRLAPVTFATRNMFIGRYGRDAESGILPPLFVGYPSLVRGYDARTFTTTNTNSAANLSINDLIGSRMYVGNVELRYPLSGPERLSAITSKFFFSELNLFTDAGVAWGSAASPGRNDNTVANNSQLVLSTGISLRVNLFGYLVVEPFYAIPWQNGGTKNGNFGLNILPGW
jgi:outer membrane protein assembly factor BamA